MTELIQKWAKIILTRETVSYLICGILTTLLSFGIYAACVTMGMSTAVCNTVATVIAMIFAYVVNKIFVFESRVWQPKLLIREITAFMSARVFSFLLETGLLMLMVDRLKLWSLGSKAVTSVIVVVLNYFLSKKAVFKDRG